MKDSGLDAEGSTLHATNPGELMKATRIPRVIHVEGKVPASARRAGRFKRMLRW